MTRLERVKLIGHNQASIPIGKSRFNFFSSIPIPDLGGWFFSFGMFAVFVLVLVWVYFRETYRLFSQS